MLRSHTRVRIVSNIDLRTLKLATAPNMWMVWPWISDFRLLTDYNIGRVLAEMESLGFKDETTVVVFGDHGYQVRAVFGRHITAATFSQVCNCGSKMQ